MQIRKFEQKRRICRANRKHAPDDFFFGPIMPSPKGYQLLPPWLAQPELGRHNGEVDHLDWWPEKVVVHIHLWEPGHEVIQTNSWGHKHKSG